jgi:hypothetical protein
VNLLTSFWCFLYVVATINFAFSFYANLDYNRLIVVYLTSSCVNWGFLARVGQFKTRVPKKPNWHTNELNTTFFLFNEPLKGSKSLIIFKISLMFRFDKWWHLSKSVHIGENSQILTVSNKKNIFQKIAFMNQLSNERATFVIITMDT